jgi:uncharacterized membrane protein
MPSRSTAQYRILGCAGIGAVLALVFPAEWGVAIRSALGWIIGVSCFLAITVFAVAGAPPEQLRQLARQQDPKRWIILGLVTLAAIASVFAVGVLLHKQSGESFIQVVGRIALLGGVVTGSWLLTHTMFALHYAHGYYGDGPHPGPDDRGGLRFPGDRPHPDFWDFLYFSLVIGMTCQVSDVQITGTHIRRLAIIHGVLSFVFNTIILAVTVNLVVNAL